MSKRARSVSACRGNSSAHCRMTACMKPSKLLADLGEACAPTGHVRNVSKRIQCDEIWQFVPKGRTSPRQKGTGTATSGRGRPSTPTKAGRPHGRRANRAWRSSWTCLASAACSSRRTASTGIRTPSSTPSASTWTTRIWSKNTAARTRRYSPAEVRRHTTEVIRGNPDSDTSPRRTWSARTSRCAWDAPVHAADERLFKEGREPRGRRAPLHALQLRRIHKTLRVTPAMEAACNHVPP